MEEKEMTEEDGIALGKAIELNSKNYFGDTLKKMISRESGKPIAEIEIADFDFDSKGLCSSCIFDITTCENMDARECGATQVFICCYYEKGERWKNVKQL